MSSTLTLTGISLPFGGQSSDGVGTQVRLGDVASRFTVTDSVLVPPSLVAMHVNVVPAVSAVTVTVSQPLCAEIGVCASLTSQLTVTSPVYQPRSPSGPVMEGTRRGGVGSTKRANAPSASVVPQPGEEVTSRQPASDALEDVPGCRPEADPYLPGRDRGGGDLVCPAVGGPPGGAVGRRRAREPGRTARSDIVEADRDIDA